MLLWEGLGEMGKSGINGDDKKRHFGKGFIALAGLICREEKSAIKPFPKGGFYPRSALLHFPKPLP